jgi:hypothetical protein
MPIELPKYTRRKLDALKYPLLLVLHDKHERDYYLCEDEAALGRACLDVLKARMDPKYGYITVPPIEPWGLTPEAPGDIDEIPAVYRNQERNTRASNLRIRRKHAETLMDYERAKDALTDGDGLGAYVVLDARKDHQYEGFDLVKPRRV